MDAAQNAFRDIEADLKAADFEFKQRRFADAVPVYLKALDGLRAARPAGHPDLIYCLTRLGDSYAFAGAYDQALPVLTELHDLRQKQPGVNNADLICVTFKVAKMFEMLGDLTSAYGAYDGAVVLGESSLYKGHPLLHTIYSQYAEMVRRSRGAPELYKMLDEKSAEAVAGGGSLGDNVLDTMNVREYMEMHMEEVALPEPEPEPEPEPPPPRPPLLTPKQLVGVLVVIVIIGAIVTAMHFAQQAMEDKKKVEAVKATIALFAGKSYESIDGLDKLTFQQDGSVDSVVDGVKRKLKFFGLPPGSSFSSGPIANARGFMETPDGMQADDGKMLYGQSAPERAMIDRLRAVASAAEKYYEEHKQYPMTMKELAAADPDVAKNPVTNSNDDVVFVDAGKDRDWNPDDAREVPPPVEALIDSQLLPHEASLSPGAVHCYTYSNGDAYTGGEKCKGLFIRGCDANGKFLPGQRPGQAYVAQMIGGRTPLLAGLYQPKEPSANDPKITIVKVIEAKPGTSAPAASTTATSTSTSTAAPTDAGTTTNKAAPTDATTPSETSSPSDTASPDTTTK
ncbi:MAG TPA: tetratricopeptide repeat protein [Planktothrix sp.]|jgi:tetratricopeptide (TPR) repeat protein